MSPGKKYLQKLTFDIPQWYYQFAIQPPHDKKSTSYEHWPLHKAYHPLFNVLFLNLNECKKSISIWGKPLRWNRSKQANRKRTWRNQDYAVSRIKLQIAAVFRVTGDVTTQKNKKVFEIKNIMPKKF